MAATGQLPPPPINSPQGSYAWLDYQVKLSKYLAGSVATWASLDKTGSNLSDIVTRNHNVLQGMQGGTLSEYYHLTSAQYNKVVNETATTQATSDNSTKVATTAYVQNQGYMTTTAATTALALKAPIDSPAFTTKVGFNGTAAITKPTVTGAKGGNAALTSLITALVNYGLITDSTT